MTLCSYCLMAGEEREEWRGRYNVTLCSYCLMAEEQREEWRGRCNVTLCSYCLMVRRVTMTHGEFISVGLGVGIKNWQIGVQQHCDVG